MSESMQCPICRADNDAPPTCRRCKADLGMLWEVHQVRTRALEAARGALKHLMLAEAEQRLREAEEIEGAADTARIRALLRLLQGRFADALRGYEKQLSSSGF